MLKIVKIIQELPNINVIIYIVLTRKNARMGITIDADIYLLCSMFNINYKKIADEYSGMSVEEIMKAEAKQGNTAAAKFDTSILSDPIKLIELFQLKDPGNKYAILSNMSEHDLTELLPLLEQSDLITGLNYFTKEKLLVMMEDLPPDQLINMVFEMFSPEQLMQLMPEEQLNKALMSTDMDKGLEIKYLKSMKPEILAQMLEAVTGQPATGSEDVGLDGKANNLDGEALAAQISALPDDKFKEAMLNIPPQNKRNFMLKMSKEDPKIFLMFSPDAYTKIIDSKKEKEDIIKSAKVLKSENLIKMVSQLPQDLTAAILTQMDTKKFADVLLANFKNIISQIIAG